MTATALPIFCITRSRRAAYSSGGNTLVNTGWPQAAAASANAARHRGNGMRLLRYGESEDRRRPIGSAGLQDRGGEFGLIGRVGEVLRFQAESAASNVRLAALSFDAAVEIISGIKLDAGFRGQHFQHAATARLFDFGGQTQSRAFAIQHVVVVVALTDFQLLVV